jgi:ABC-type Fe3+-hydroxamate transport system substrate-binding protein
MAARTITDMLGRTIELQGIPCRIISLVPSQTELLYDLGLDAEVVGITRFCIHPGQWFRNKKRVGGTKNVNIATISALQPDLIIANKEENTREQIEELAQLYPVWISDIKNVEDALRMIASVGELVGREPSAQTMIKEITESFNGLSRFVPARRVAYFIWRDPWMCAGGDTFINDIISRAGWLNVLADTMRYPSISLSDMLPLDVDTILLSSEPYPFKDRHIAEIKEVLPHAEVILVDGELFSWYGSRMKYTAQYLQKLFS